jgi:hypothetical protein
MSDSQIFADYGTMKIKPETLALLRGTGNFNEPPKYEQSINRSYNPLDYYAHSKYYNEDQSYKAADNIENGQRDTKWIPFYDNINKQKYSVGSTDLHAEDNLNSWTRPDFQLSRGTDQYQVWALNSMQLVPSILLYLFFSADNIDYIQDTLISETMRIRGETISRQSTDDLLIIMRNKYMYALSGWLPSAGDTSKPQARGTIINPSGLAYGNETGGCTDLEVQLTRLNKSVIEECMKMILSGITAYKKYYLDSSSIPMALSHPVMASMKGAKGLQENLGFVSGHEMSNAISSYNERFNII